MFVIKHGEQIKLNLKLTADNTLIIPANVTEIEIRIGVNNNPYVVKKKSLNEVVYDATTGLTHPWSIELTREEILKLPVSTLLMDAVVTFLDSQIYSNIKICEIKVMDAV